jgi:transposase
MKVLIGVDPHKGSVAVAALDQATGELLERAGFPQNHAGLKALERWAKRFPKRRWAVENAGGLGRHLAGRLAAAGESVVDVPPKLSARVRVLSSGNARKNDGIDALATALAASRNDRLAAVDPEDSSEVLRLLSERREDLVAERTRALKAASTRSLGTSSPAGWPGSSRPRGQRASCAPYVPRVPRPASDGGWPRRCCATSGRWTRRSLTWAGASKPR